MTSRVLAVSARWHGCALTPIASVIGSEMAPARKAAVLSGCLVASTVGPCRAGMDDLYAGLSVVHPVFPCRVRKTAADADGERAPSYRPACAVRTHAAHDPR